MLLTGLSFAVARGPSSVRAASAPTGPLCRLPLRAFAAPADDGVVIPSVIDAHVSSIQFVPKDIATNPRPVLPERDPVTGWTMHSRRCGVLGRKVGMLSAWDTRLKMLLPLTVVDIGGCYVTQVLPEVGKAGTANIQVGAGDSKRSSTTLARLGHFAKADVPARKKLTEFRVTMDAIVPLGHLFSPKHFAKGQFVDVQGTTVGKGFAGVMKRWDFRGQPASHGVSVVHRSMGGGSGRQDPGKTWKGKKMPGHMGSQTRTVRSLQVWKIDTEENVIYLHGSVPGKPGTWLRITDAAWKRFTSVPPFPTYFPKANEPVGEIEYGVKPPGWMSKATIQFLEAYKPGSPMPQSASEKRQSEMDKKKREASDREERKRQSRAQSKAKDAAKVARRAERQGASAKK